MTLLPALSHEGKKFVFLQIIDKLGSWSVLNNYIQPSWNLEEMLIQHNKLGFSPLFIIDVDVDMKNSSRYVVVVSPRWMMVYYAHKGNSNSTNN